MRKRSMILIVVMMVFSCIAYAASSSLVGVVSDSSCGTQHSQASAAAASCVKSCIASGGKYVLVSQGKVYQVSPQSKFADYAGQEVRVRGKVAGESIAVTSVAPVQKGDPKKSMAKMSY